MKIKLDVSAVLAVALGCFASSASANMKYTPEKTNDWIRVTGQQLGSATIAAGTEIGTGCWCDVPASGDITPDAEADKLRIETDIASPLSYTNKEDVARSVYRIEATIKVTLSAELPDPGSLAKTALCVCTNGLEGASAQTNWWAYINSEWRNLGGEPTIDGTYTIALDSDTTNCVIRYFAKTGVGEYVPLTDGWVSNPASSEPITKLAFAGSTELSTITGDGFVQGYAAGDGTIYDNIDAAVANTTTGGVYTPVSTGGVVVASAKIDKVWMEANEATTVAGLNGNGENGIARWQSYVLGLDPKVATSKPVVQPEQNAEAGKVAFSMGNVAVNAEAGVPVKYRVNTYSDSSATTPSGTPGEFVASSENFMVDLPTDGVKYYKMEIQFGE